MPQAQLNRYRALRSVVVDAVGSPDELRERVHSINAAAIRKLGARLVELELITPEQLEHALQLQSAVSGVRLGHLLVDLGFVSEAHLAQVVCEQLGIPLVDLESFPIDRNAVLPLLPEQCARRHGMLPLCRIDGRLFVAMSDPLDLQALEAARFCARMTVMPVMALRQQVFEAIGNLYYYGAIAYGRTRGAASRPAPALAPRDAEAARDPQPPRAAPPHANQNRGAYASGARPVQSRMHAAHRPVLQPAVVERAASPEQLRARVSRMRDAAMSKLGARLVELRLLSREQLDRALHVQRARSSLHLGQVLTALGFVSEAHLRQVVCEQLGIPIVDLDRFQVDRSMLDFMPERSARQYRMLPLCWMDAQLYVAIADPLDTDTLEHARFCTQLPIAPVMALRHEIERAIVTLYKAPVMPSAPRRAESKRGDVHAALAWR
ncbi:MAG TPA: hypothetical protein VHP37_15345 [Burkholderiales bacterium]|nr:hypothetical protein [Burkholderiales bacterium]